MSTKILLGLAALAVGLSTAFAQVVRTVDISLQANKLHFLSVPLIPKGGNFNITNSIVFDPSQDGASLFAWAGAQWSTTVPTWIGDSFGDGWDTSMVISNGVGFFLASAANSTLTFTGEVPEGAIAYNIPVGLSTLANKIPLSENFPGSTVGNTGDNLFTWDQAGQKWASVVWLFLGPEVGGSGWDNGGAPGNNTNGPSLNPGEAVFYVNGGAAIRFVRNFTFL